MDNFDLKKYLAEGKLLNESAPGYDNRKFGESLPTMEGVKAAYEAKKEDITDAADWNFEESIEKIIDELKEYQKVNPQDDLQTAINHLESLLTLESVKAAYEAKNDIKEDKPLPNIEQFINDKDFMESFIANAEESYEHFGDFKNMFDVYEKEGLTEEQIGDLLEYCDENDLISY